MKRLKIGIIGLGIGEEHISGYKRHPACEVIALCDLSAEKLRSSKEKYPHLMLHRSADDILNDPDIDIVSIASYDNYHYEQVVQALSKNKHVFVEKPLCLYEKEARHIRSILRANPGVKLSSNMVLRKSPRFRYLKKTIEKGGLGTLFYVESDYNYGRLEKITEGWRGKIGFYSVIYGGGVHVVDLLIWLTGGVVIEVSAYGNNISSKGRFKYNDMVVAILKFKSGLIGKVAANMGCVFPHFHTMSIYGTKATFVNGFHKGLLFESRDLAKKPREINKAYPGVCKGDLILSFVDSVLGTAKAEVTEEDVFNTMSVCFAIEKAAKKGRPVQVDYI
ncbi:MAG: hypothetical protein A2987_01830 [Omnitrophica bacterium RIFCSPLOWO2_01_FULL_45_10]|nr:MAG: hypothetical protein A2987_01830 [Omnitrophica bacterium RIFCSPLOWO2_01_FULL_45_10]